MWKIDKFSTKKIDGPTENWLSLQPVGLQRKHNALHALLLNLFTKAVTAHACMFMRSRDSVSFLRPFRSLQAIAWRGVTLTKLFN